MRISGSHQNENFLWVLARLASVVTALDLLLVLSIVGGTGVHYAQRFQGLPSWSGPLCFIGGVGLAGMYVTLLAILSDGLYAPCLRHVVARSAGGVLVGMMFGLVSKSIDEPPILVYLLLAGSVMLFPLTGLHDWLWRVTKNNRVDDGEDDILGLHEDSEDDAVPLGKTVETGTGDRQDPISGMDENIRL